MHRPGGTTSHRGPSTRDHQQTGTSPGLRTSPSGRTPRWVVEEAVEQQRQAQLSPRRRRREARRVARATRRTARRWAGVSGRCGRAWRASPAIGVVTVMALYFSPTLYDRFARPYVRPYFSHASAPPPGVEASGHPLGTPPVVADTGSYRFMESPDPDQEMVAYDPCRPVRVVVRSDNAPPGGQQLIEEAIGAVSAATGLQFVDAGATTEAPSRRREPYQPDRYGRQWAPVLIARSDADEYPNPAGNRAGLGDSTAQQAPGGPFVYVTGEVILDVPSLTAIMDRPEQVRAVIMHELGHVVGLDHVDDPKQLMYGANMGVTGFAPGDRAGLAELGAGECVPKL